MRKYKKTSKLVNNTGYTPGYASESNPVNYIPSQNITMENTPYPVYGQPLDQFGNPIANPTYMEPGMNYDYGSDAAYVAETPAYKDGGMKQDWISEKIGELIKEGRPQKQAIAIAYSMWEQKHEMGGTHLPMMQDAGTWYKNNPPGFAEGFGNPEYLASQEGQAANTNTPNKFNFKANPQIGGPLNLNTKAEPWKYGLGQDPNYVNPLSTESFTAGKDWAAKNPLPAGVKQPMATSIGFEPMSAMELSKGVQNAKVTNDGGAAARTTTGITQFYNPYGGYSMSEKLGFAGENIQKDGFLNKAAGALAGASAIAEGVQAFLSPMAAQRRQQQVMKTYAEEQRKNMTGENNPTAFAYGGYYQNGGVDKSNYEEEVNAEMDKNYPEFGPQNMPEGKVATDWYEKGMDKDTYYGFKNQLESEGYESIPKPESEEKTSANFDSNSARDNWVQKTGLPWSEAKRLGYTDGTAKDNIKLLSELKNPNFKAESLRKAPVTRKAVNTKQEAPVTNKTTPKAPPVINKKKSTYVDPYKGMYEDSEGDIRNAQGVMVGLDGEELNWFERNFSDQGVIPPMDKNGRRMAKPGYGASTEEWNAWNKARYDNSIEAAKAKQKAAAGRKKPVQSKPYVSPFAPTTPSYNPTDPFGLSRPTFFQEGGMQPEMEEGQGEMPQQAGGDQMQAIAQEVAGMLQQGVDPQEILQQLVQAGLPEEQAMQVIQMVMEQMQGAQPQATPQLGRGGEMIKRTDGSYSKRGLWDNIRANKGSGKAPTKQMLEQEAKIKSEYKEGGINNAGFQALPEDVKAKILASMEEGGMYDMEEYAEGGTIPERYKNDGFTKVGVKRQSTRPGKKWMVLAKKGDQYKVVHGGDDNMKDFSQHGSEDRKENFWNRMGGRDSAKANDPFSPLYWHKKFGTWQEGGEMMDEQMEGENEMVEGETPNQEGIESQVEQALKQGADPQEILQQLVQMGMPEQEAIQMIQEIMQEIQNGETAQESPEEGQPMMKNGGEYLEALKGKKIKNYTYNKNTGNYDVELE